MHCLVFPCVAVIKSKVGQSRPNVVQSYGNRDCQASKGFDKYVPDDDAGFVDV
jgi:hypothetical protein